MKTLGCTIWRVDRGATIGLRDPVNLNPTVQSDAARTVMVFIPFQHVAGRSPTSFDQPLTHRTAYIVYRERRFVGMRNIYRNNISPIKLSFRSNDGVLLSNSTINASNTTKISVFKHRYFTDLSSETSLFRN